MKSLFLAIALTLPGLAQADIIKCNFTEPFYLTTYSMTQSTLTIEGPDMPKQVIKNVSFQIVGSNQFELWSKNKQVLMKLNLNFQGSDGMSDLSYPYDAQWLQKGGLYGGCQSNFLKAAEAP